MAIQNAITAARRGMAEIGSAVNGGPVVLREHKGNFYAYTKNSKHKDSFRSMVAHHIGHHIANACDHSYPLDMLVPHRNVFVAHQKHFKLPDDEMKLFVKLIDQHAELLEKRFHERVAQGAFEFSDLPRLYSQGTEVFVPGGFDGMDIGGVIQSVAVEDTWTGQRFLRVNLSVIHSAQGDVRQSSWSTRIGAFEGLLPVDVLPIRAATEADKEKLTDRGILFRRVSMKPSYMMHSGHLTQRSYWSDRRYRADGRCMIDSSTFRMVDNDTWDKCFRQLDLDRNGDSDKNDIITELPDDKLWMTFPVVLGFSFAAKQWGEMRLDALSEINFRDDAWDILVLDDEEKTIIRALVEHSGKAFGDIVEGKGGGCIFLLHGPPGEGKTLTAETVADLLKRPLYSVSVGELGVTPDELEERLRVILDVAITWNAVILLDEADIYLEERDKNDIVRNAMVGVFLRLLEYHQGVLFLTTNRVRDIDQAFYSRVSLGIHYPKGSPEKRRKIWDNLLKAAGINLNVNGLSNREMNGRQIKNVIRLAQTLAYARNEQVTVDLLEKVIEVSARFDPNPQEPYASGG